MLTILGYDEVFAWPTLQELLQESCSSIKK